MTTAFGCLNNTIRVRSGGYLDLADPQPDQFTLTDIAGALSKICRFGGQCDRFYSVAEHSIHCAVQGWRDGLSKRAQIALLMHDAAEAFVGDCVKPLKIMLPDYWAVEQRMESAIAEKFGINFSKQHAAVEEIDRAMLIAERHAMFQSDHITWTGENEVRKLTVAFQHWMPENAEEIFMLYADLLGI